MYIKGCDNSSVHESEEERRNYRENFKNIRFERVEWDEDKKAWVSDVEYWATHEIPRKRHYIHDNELGKSILESEYIKRHGRTTRMNENKRILLRVDNPTPLEYKKHTKADGVRTEIMFKKILK